MRAYIYNPSTWKARVGGSGVQGHPLVHNLSEVTLYYMRPCFKSSNKRFLLVLSGSLSAQSVNGNGRLTCLRQSENEIFHKHLKQHPVSALPASVGSPK